MSYLFAGLEAALALTGAAQTRPAVDDWDIQQDRPRELTVASVSYSSGTTLSVQCLAGDLLVAVTGLPPAAAGVRRYDRRVAGGQVEQTDWRPAASGAGITSSSARLARSFRRGGRLELVGSVQGGAPVEIALDLPTQSSNLDRVLTACGQPVSDPFDGALGIGDLLIEQPRVRIPEPAFRSYDAGQVTMECRIANARLRDCRVTRITPANPRLEAEAVRSANGTRVRLRDHEAAEGRVVEFTVSNIN